MITANTVRKEHQEALYSALHPGQHYVADISGMMGIEASIMRHDVHTETCYEKAKILGWDDEPFRVVKALYFKDDLENTIGIIMPEIGNALDTRRVLSETVPEYAPSGKRAKSFSLREPPAGMTRGTCTPFPLEGDIGNGIKAMIFCEYSPTMGKTVDISIGGYSEEHFRTSMHIRYEDIFRILDEKFGKCAVIRKHCID